MSRPADLSPLLAPPAKPDVGFRQGVLLAWDPRTSSNIVQVAGAILDDLPTLAASTIELAPGDTVGLLRFQSTYFIMGRIAAAGSGALAIRAASILTEETTTSATYTDLATVGPSVDAYIGSSRQCLVMIQFAGGVAGPAAASATVVVTGASSVSGASPAFIGTDDSTAISASAASITLFSLADGLNSGLNTFTMKYQRTDAGAGAGAAIFGHRLITVIPF